MSVFSMQNFRKISFEKLANLFVESQLVREMITNFYYEKDLTKNS